MSKKNTKAKNSKENTKEFVKKAALNFVVILVIVVAMAVCVGIISERDNKEVFDTHLEPKDINEISTTDDNGYIDNDYINNDYVDNDTTNDEVGVEIIKDEAQEYTGEKVFEDVPEFFEDMTEYSENELIKENITVDGKVHTNTNVEGEITNFPESTYKIINSGECIPVLAGDYVVEEIVIDSKHIENEVIFNITYLDNSFMRNYGLTFENKEDKQSLYVGKVITVDKDSAAGVAGATIVLKRR